MYSIDCFVLKRTSVPVLAANREIGESSLVCDHGLFGFRRYLALVGYNDSNDFNK